MDNWLLSSHFAPAYNIRATKSRKIRWVEHAAQIEKYKVYSCFKSEVVKGHVIWHVQVKYLYRLQNEEHQILTCRFCRNLLAHIFCRPRESDEWNSSLYFKRVRVFLKAPDIAKRLQAIPKHFNENRNFNSIFFTIKQIRCTNFPDLLRQETLHVSDSSSAHHQEFIHTGL